MIRTRDALLLCGAILIIGVGMLLTVLLQREQFTESSRVLLDRGAVEQSVFKAETNREEKNRQGNIERLRALIASQEQTITPSPSVGDEAPSEDAKNEDEATSVSALLLCGGDDTVTVRPQWPSDVSLRIEGGDRLVFSTIPNPNFVPATSTEVAEPEVITKTIMTMRAFPVKGEVAQCVPGTVVGVTTSGGLIMNDAAYYSEYGSDSFIGYARDGFPIYGFYDGEVDVCGGYHHPAGYRYTLTEGREAVLNCFYNTPSTFTL